MLIAISISYFVIFVPLNFSTKSQKEALLKTIRGGGKLKAFITIRRQEKLLNALIILK